MVLRIAYSIYIQTQNPRTVREYGKADTERDGIRDRARAIMGVGGAVGPSSRPNTATMVLAPLSSSPAVADTLHRAKLLREARVHSRDLIADHSEQEQVDDLTIGTETTQGLYHIVWRLFLGFKIYWKCEPWSRTNRIHNASPQTVDYLAKTLLTGRSPSCTRRNGAHGSRTTRMDTNRRR